MSFRDSLKAFIDPTKLADAEKVFDKLDEQLDGYDADIKALKKTLREKDGIKPEDFAKLEEENATLRQSKADAEKALKKAESEAKGAKETAEQFRERTHKLVKDDGLRKALVETGIKKEYLDAVHALLRDSIQVDDEKGEAFALSKDKDGKESRASVADYVKAWGAGEQGKNFVGVPASSGGGAQGGGSGSGASSSLAAKYEEAQSKGDVTSMLNIKRQMQLVGAEGA